MVIASCSVRFINTIVLRKCLVAVWATHLSTLCASGTQEKNFILEKRLREALCRVRTRRVHRWQTDHERRRRQREPCAYRPHIGVKAAQFRSVLPIRRCRRCRSEEHTSELQSQFHL